MAAWVLGLVGSTLVWIYGRRWLRVLRVLSAAFTAAIFFTPGVLAGHGLAFVPGLMLGFFQPGSDAVVFFFVLLGATWVLFMLIFAVISLMDKPPEA